MVAFLTILSSSFILSPSKLNNLLLTNVLMANLLQKPVVLKVLGETQNSLNTSPPPPGSPASVELVGIGFFLLEISCLLFLFSWNYPAGQNQRRNRDLCAGLADVERWPKIFGSEHPGICELRWRTVPVISVVQKHNFYYWFQLRNKSEVAGWAVGSHVLNEGQCFGVLGFPDILPQSLSVCKTEGASLRSEGSRDLLSGVKTQELFWGCPQPRGSGSMVGWVMTRLSVCVTALGLLRDPCVLLSH